MNTGTVGWAVPRENADRFESDGSALSRYSGRLPAVEINSSFHRPHRRTTYARWAASVPEGFRFAVKLPKTISHAMRLKDCNEPLERFLDEISGLGQKLGPVLVQLPPSLPLDTSAADTFFDALRSRHSVCFGVECVTPQRGIQVTAATAESSDEVGSRSAPIVTPRLSRICELQQRLSSILRGVTLRSRSTGERDIVETIQRPIKREGVETLHWWTAAYNRPRSREELDDAISRRVTLTTSDGPYARTEYLAEKLVGKVVGVLAPDRHTRDELSRRIYMRNRPAHMPSTDYTRGPEPGYVEPAGSANYHERTGLRRKAVR